MSNKRKLVLGNKPVLARTIAEQAARQAIEDDMRAHVERHVRRQMEAREQELLRGLDDLLNLGVMW